MRILIYGLNYWPELTGIGKYNGEMAEWLVSQGHEVHVIAAPPYYPKWEVGSDYRNSYMKEHRNGVDIFRVPLWVPSNPTGLTRIVHLLSFAIASLGPLFRQVRWRPDVVWLVEPPFMCSPGALLLAKLCASRTWLHVQDFEVDAAFSLNILKNKFAQNLVLKAEKVILRRFDRVSSISGKMVEKVLQKGVDKKRAVLFPNWVDIDKIKPVEGDRHYRNLFAVSDECAVALYSGNMGAKQGIEILAEVASELSYRDDIVFVFCGGGAAKASLEAKCAGMRNVRFMELQPLAMLPSLLGFADIHLLPQSADAADLVMPSKLTGMLASGRPVVATAAAGTELADVLAGCGVVVPPGNARAMASAISDLADDKCRRLELGRMSREYAEKMLSREDILARFEQNLATLTG